MGEGGADLWGFEVTARVELTPDVVIQLLHALEGRRAAARHCVKRCAAR